VDPATPQPPPAMPGGYPAVLEIDQPEHVANWRPLVHWLLVIPHWIVLYVLGIVAEVVSIVAWFAILFTGKMPDGLANLIALYIRYSNRVTAYAQFMREEYPPFSFDSVPQDPGDYPGVRTQLAPELEDRNRLTTAFRFILVIPHLFVLAILGIVVFFAMIGAFFVVLFTGRWPDGLFTFVLGFMRWVTRVNAYFLLLTDEYPPFSMD
jgi:Domain of unknown function (DUF4389)